jgi:tRNA (cytidine56-2'-O)-methyltransferase
MYGMTLDEAVEAIRASPRPKLVVVGAEKVERFYYEESDYNVSVGNQPHSEVAALAVFLDRLFRGRSLYQSFEGARLRIVPSPRGKKVVSVD